MTDILTGSLAAFAGPELVIAYPPEKDTGGDLDLIFWNVKHKQSIHLRIQAKRLNAEKDGSRKIRVEHRSYNEILHRPCKSAEYQYETLSKAPFPFVPLYMFYNHLKVVKNSLFRSSSPVVSGVNLAFAFDIACELNAKLSAQNGNPREIKHHKRLSYLRKHFFGLERILCPKGDWEGAGVPTPEAVSASLREIWLLGGKGQALTEDEALILRRYRWPSLPHHASDDQMLITSGPAVRVDRSIRLPTITFISGRTGDGRTPHIWTSDSEMVSEESATG